MTYRFTGVFTNDDLVVSNINPKKFVLKNVEKITNHDVMYGIFFPDFISNDASQIADCAIDYFKELQQFGLKKALYINYVYWGGMLEQLDSFIIENNIVVAGTQVSYSDLPENKMTEKFISIMKSFDINLDSSGYFKAFERGFWGEDGY